jgi:Zn-dependent peptidase ImmA (M78 family)
MDTTMTKSRREQINKLAEKIRTEANLPVPLTTESIENFVQKLGGNLEYKKLDKDLDGCITKIEDNFTITINESNYATEERKKFTLGHELGHLFLHMKFLNEDEWNSSNDFEDKVYGRNGYTEEEYDAHEFAAALLMPKKIFIEKVKENTTDNKCNVNILAEYFGVSVDAATNRGKWIGIFKW